MQTSPLPQKRKGPSISIRCEAKAWQLPGNGGKQSRRRNGELREGALCDDNFDCSCWHSQQYLHHRTQSAVGLPPTTYRAHRQHVGSFLWTMISRGEGMGTIHYPLPSLHDAPAIHWPSNAEIRWRLCSYPETLLERHVRQTAWSRCSCSLNVTRRWSSAVAAM